jgi:hypothetical protein
MWIYLKFELFFFLIVTDCAKAKCETKATATARVQAHCTTPQFMERPQID